MEKKYILALDQGTTSSRAILFNKEVTFSLFDISIFQIILEITPGSMI